jgi:DNA-binding transcriptional ArsR family regulator
VHLLPAERSGHRVIDGERVSDLAAATGVHDTTVSQTLRYLRVAEVVTTERDGRVIRYRLADGPVAALLAPERP